MVSGKSADHTRIEQRQALLNDLRERYARFGDQVVQYLCDKSSQRGGLRMMLGKVLRPLPHEDDRMHDALVRFLSTEGVDAFFARIEPQEKKVVTGTTGEGSVRTFGRDFDGVPVLEVDESDQRTVEGYRPRAIPLEQTSEPAPPAGEPPVSEPQTPAQTAEPPVTAPQEPTSAATEFPLPSAGPRVAGETPWDGQERRSGFEERLGLERRSGKERRKAVDVIFKNLRFGGQRRTGIERRCGRDRREDPPPPNL